MASARSEVVDTFPFGTALEVGTWEKERACGAFGGGADKGKVSVQVVAL